MTKHASFLDQHLAIFETLLKDPTTVELVVNPDGVVWYEKIGMPYMAKWEGEALSIEEITTLTTNICNELEASYSNDKPIISGSINYLGIDLRAQVVGFKAVRKAASIVLRKDTKANLDGSSPLC